MLEQAGQDAPKRQPILDVNPAHALLERLQASKDFDDLAQGLFDRALLAGADRREHPAAHVQRVNKLLTARAARRARAGRGGGRYFGAW